MLRGPLGKAKYRPKFSGHDTFPFRYAWLTKIVHYLEEGDIKKIKEFERYKLQTMSEFGVGLNMVKSMRHWSLITKVCDKNFGYGTKNHLKAIKKFGITIHHRKTFSPIKKVK